jgi:hypothetical protein
MDLKQYFKKVSDIHASIKEQYPLIVSLETSDGGKPGVAVEVSRREAAKAIAEGRAALADEEQKKVYLEQETGRKKFAEKAELSRRLQIAIISESDLRDAVTKPGKEEERKSSR